MDMIALSKTIAHALRHEPMRYDLEIDSDGWANAGVLLNALRRDPRFRDADADALRAVVDADEKGRYEMTGDRIRALYGHSFPLRIAKERCTPPDVLYHGTAKRFLPSILQTGLTPQKRQYVHLSADPGTAHTVGLRRDGQPAMLLIDAARAARDGIAFYASGSGIFLADRIPPEYITLT